MFSMDDLDAILEDPKECLKSRIVLCSSFEMYLRFMFFAVNGAPITLKPFHFKVINKLERLEFQTNEKRNLALALPVGSGKSLLVQYWLSWSFSRSIDKAFLYTSNSSDLISRLSKETKDIVTSDVYQTIFNIRLKKDERSKVCWSFDDSKKRTGLMAKPTGGSITGMDAGNPIVKGFSGALIIDDPLDAKYSRYETYREECIADYEGKLKNRRRTPTTPTLLIAQRLDLHDLIGHLKATEPSEWDFVDVPAIDEEGKSFWPERYPVKEMEAERERNPYNFYAQYQQAPIVAGGQVIQSEWFEYWQSLEDVKFKQLFMTADTAQKIKEKHDYSVFCLWGIDKANLYLIDMIRDKWEAHDLLKRAKSFWDVWKQGINGKRIGAMYIEDKSSGTGLIQTLKHETRIPVRSIRRVTDKLERITDVIPTIASHKVRIPKDKKNYISQVLIAECDSFSRDMKHKHDDIIDNMVDACNIFSGGFTRADLN